MENSPEKNFGFEYEHNGRVYAAHLVASTQEEAISRIRSLADGRCIGQLYIEPNATKAQFTESASI